MDTLDPRLVPVGWQGPQTTQVQRLLLLVKHLPSTPGLVAGEDLVEGGIEVAAGRGAGFPTEMLPAVLERLDVPTASLLPPAGDPHTGPLTLPGVGRQHLRYNDTMIQ